MQSFNDSNVPSDDGIGRIKHEIREKMLSYILAAFGLVAGLAWNEAIKELIEYIFPNKGNSLIAKFIYALALTVILVCISVYLAKLFKKDEKPAS